MNQLLKTYYRYSFFSPFILLVFLLLASCEDGSDEDNNPIPRQDIITEKSTIMSSSQTDQFAYVRKYLGHIGMGLLQFSQNSEFKELLYSEIDRQFDGDNNVLLQMLIDRSASGKINLISETDQFLSRNNVDGNVTKSMRAFEDLGNEKLTLYPQIFIPFYEELRRTNKIDNGQGPVIVIFDGNESVDKEIGYQLEKNGIKQLETFVDEKFLRNNEVWVISLNDRTPADVDRERLKTEALGSPNCDPNNQNWTDGYIANLILHCNMEGVLSGKNDVRIITGSSWDDGINPLTGLAEYHWVGDPDHREVIKISKDDVQADKNFYVNFLAYQGWNPADVPNSQGSVGPFLYWLFYEHDNWPESLKTGSYTVSWTGYTLNWLYRSAESHLGRGFINHDDYTSSNGSVSFPQSSCGYAWGVSCFEFNTRRE